MSANDDPTLQRYRRVLEQTVSADAFSAEGSRAMLEQTQIAGGVSDGISSYVQQSSTLQDTEALQDEGVGEAPPEIARSALSLKLEADSAAKGAEARFSIDRKLGAGATGFVFAARDCDLDREVALKVFRIDAIKDKARIAHLFTEARTTARLEHPNILPIYDVEQATDGRVCFVMRQIRGETLGSLLRRAAQCTSLPEQIDSHHKIIQIFLKVTDALRYAHHRGVTHQDVKPDNIMLGNFGEVLLLDWGSSSTEQGPDQAGKGRQIVGTPAYMSPEQARREAADFRSDIYCLGASMFHCLALRHPTWGSSLEEFWQKKTAGVVDPLTRDERASIPAPLLAIILKTLEARPDDRYQTMDELAEDLERFGSGRAMSWRILFKGDFSSRTSSDLARDWRLFSCPDWVMPHETQFDEAAGWRLRDGKLLGQNLTGFDNITFKRRVVGNLRVDWTVKALVKPENLNCFIAGNNRNQGYTVHISAFGVPGFCLLTKGDASFVLDQCTLEHAPLAGATYRCRAEKEGTFIRFYFDDKLLFEYNDSDVLSGPLHQSFGFENSSGNALEIDDLTVYYQPLPLELSPIAIPEQYIEDGQLELAMEHLGGVVEAYPDHEISRTAQFRMALVCVLQEDYQKAIEILQRFEEENEGHPLTPLALFHRARCLAFLKRVAECESLYLEIARRFPGHSVLRTVFSEVSGRIEREYYKPPIWIQNQGDVHVQSIVDGRRKLDEWAGKLGAEVKTSKYLHIAARSLLSGRYPEVVLERFADLPEECALALIDQGKFEEVLNRYPGISSACAEALHQMGRLDELFAKYPQERNICALALGDLGRFEEILSDYPDQADACAGALIALGRPEEALSRYPDNAGRCVYALRITNRTNEARLKYRNNKRLQVVLLDATGDYEPMLKSSSPEKVNVALLAMCRLEEVVAADRDPGGRLKALCRLGRVDEGLAIRSTRRFAAKSLLEANYPEMVLERFPEDRFSCSGALNHLGRHEEVASGYRDRSKERVRALLQMGEFERVLAEYPRQLQPCTDALIALDRIDDAARLAKDNVWTTMNIRAAKGDFEGWELEYRDYPSSVTKGLVLAGRAERALESFGYVPSCAGMTLTDLGRFDEVVERFSHDRSMLEWVYPARCCRGLESIHRNQVDAGLSELRAANKESFSYAWTQPDLWFCRGLLLPATELFTGRLDLAAFVSMVEESRRSHSRRFCRDLWYAAGFVLGGMSDTEFGEQPHRNQVEARALFVHALRADITGASKASELYREFLDLPAYRRGNVQVIRQFARWRAGLPCD